MVFHIRRYVAIAAALNRYRSSRSDIVWFIIQPSLNIFWFPPSRCIWHFCFLNKIWWCVTWRRLGCHRRQARRLYFIILWIINPLIWLVEQTKQNIGTLQKVNKEQNGFEMSVQLVNIKTNKINSEYQVWLPFWIPYINAGSLITEMKNLFLFSCESNYPRGSLVPWFNSFVSLLKPKSSSLPWHEFDEYPTVDPDSIHISILKFQHAHRCLKHIRWIHLTEFSSWNF